MVYSPRSREKEKYNVKSTNAPRKCGLNLVGTTYAQGARNEKARLPETNGTKRLDNNNINDKTIAQKD
jgi:hypothetical protein